MPNPVLSVRISDKLARDLESRAAFLGGRAEAARTDLARYRALVRATQTRLASEGFFSPDEQALILETANGSDYGANPGLIVGSVADAMTLDNLDEVWGVDRDTMRFKMGSLGALECAAIVDAAERFWASVAAGDDKQPEPRGGLFG